MKRLNDPVEILYLTLMYRWETSAPPDRGVGLLDGSPERNSQISRMVYLLRKIAAGDTVRVYSSLAQSTRRKDGHSYISDDPVWMENPAELGYGWYFEGGTSLVQKQDILQALRKLGLSAPFIACADNFVAGRSVLDCFPTEEEEQKILARLKDQQSDEEE